MMLAIPRSLLSHIQKGNQFRLFSLKQTLVLSTKSKLLTQHILSIKKEL